MNGPTASSRPGGLAEDDQLGSRAVLGTVPEAQYLTPLVLHEEVRPGRSGAFSEQPLLVRPGISQGRCPRCCIFICVLFKPRSIVFLRLYKLPFRSHQLEQILLSATKNSDQYPVNTSVIVLGTVRYDYSLCFCRQGECILFNSAAQHQAQCLPGKRETPKNKYRGIHRIEKNINTRKTIALVKIVR